MPRMDGMETLRRLRQKSDLPVIFLTSKDEEIDELFGLKRDRDGCENVTVVVDQSDCGHEPLLSAFRLGRGLNGEQSSDAPHNWASEEVTEQCKLG